MVADSTWTVSPVHTSGESLPDTRYDLGLCNIERAP